MSIESAKAFLKRLETDEDFKKELEEQATAEERTIFAKTEGFDFSKEEMDTIKSELSDDELGTIVGGALGIGLCNIGKNQNKS